jgi:hypothetical protein
LSWFTYHSGVDNGHDYQMHEMVQEIVHAHRPGQEHEYIQEQGQEKEQEKEQAQVQAQTQQKSQLLLRKGMGRTRARVPPSANQTQARVGTTARARVPARESASETVGARTSTSKSARVAQRARDR